jgi:hypothetical protein
MDAFIKIFVGQPLVLLVIAALFFIGYFVTRSNPNLRAKALLAPAVLWLLWAVWGVGVDYSAFLTRSQHSGRSIAHLSHRAHRVDSGRHHVIPQAKRISQSV